MKRFIKCFAIALVLCAAISVFSACDDDKDAKDTELPYETLDMDGWSPVWTP